MNVTISPLFCKGCGYCVRFCPSQVLKIGTQRSKRGFFLPEVTDNDKCTSCAICARVCPDGAITVTKDE